MNTIRVLKQMERTGFCPVYSIIRETTFFLAHTRTPISFSANSNIPHLVLGDRWFSGILTAYQKRIDENEKFSEILKIIHDCTNLLLMCDSLYLNWPQWSIHYRFFLLTSSIYWTREIYIVHKNLCSHFQKNLFEHEKTSIIYIFDNRTNIS